MVRTPTISLWRNQPLGRNRGFAGRGVGVTLAESVDAARKPKDAEKTQRIFGCDFAIKGISKGG